MFALTHGLPPDFRDMAIGLTLSTIAASIVVHGLSVTPVTARAGDTTWELRDTSPGAAIALALAAAPSWSAGGARRTAEYSDVRGQ